jgi:hypothetical protein
MLGGFCRTLVPMINFSVNGRSFSIITSGTSQIPQKVAKTDVVKIRRKNGVVVQDCDVYIGRAVKYGGWDLPKSKWHNPFRVDKSATFEEKMKVLDKFEKHMRDSSILMSSLHELEGKVLGCWCKDHPAAPCHGDVLVKLLAETVHKSEKGQFKKID